MDRPNEARKMGTMTRIVLVIVGAAAYLALAVLGWGGPAAFFSHPALIALAVATGVLAIVAFFAGGNVSSGVREDRTNRWVVVAFTLIGLLLGFFPAYTDRIGFWTIDGDSLRWVGVALYVAGGALRLWPVFVLGNRFSGLVAIQPGHTLVTGGIYRLIRHPSYLGLLTNALGWALAFRSVVGVLLAAALIPVLVARIHAEEALLQSEFGNEYEAYRKRTARLIPGIY
jgi:protein-S-isoprenylcysteine O-methyltransferase Ste14